jgi:cell division protease FtsH
METNQAKRATSLQFWVGGLLLLLLLVWEFWSAWPARLPEVTLPYSRFLAEVRAGNVSRVEIAGDQITAILATAIAWPPPGDGAGTDTLEEYQAYTTTHTTFPELIGDPALMDLLGEHDVVVDVTPASTPWLGLIISNALPLILFLVVMGWMGQRALQSNQAHVSDFTRSKARRHADDEPALVTFNDVAGADEAKSDLQEVVDFLRDPRKYHEIGARIPRGVLLVGPPGTGKTLLARAVAGEAAVPFFEISASEFVEMFVGVGASRVRALFEQAKESAPAIVFIDELDAVGRRRGAGVGTVNDEREQTLNQLLVAMDGFDERHEVIVLAATNRPDVLDPALLRPGRFDRQVVVDLPDRQGREAILRIHIRRLALAEDVNPALLARSTTGFSGADLANLCNEAALLAAHRNHPRVTQADFDAAIDKLLLGSVRPLLLDAHDRHVVAVHEAGHALVAWLTPEADPVHKVTIIPHGRALGVTEQIPGEDRYNYDRATLDARLGVMLAGRAAEVMIFNEVTTGAENDLIEATTLARRMVTRWAMGHLGLMAFGSDEGQPFLGYELARAHPYSEATAAQIDQDIQNVLAQRYQAVQALLQRSRALLETLAQELLREETIDQEALLALLGPRPLVPVGVLPTPAARLTGQAGWPTVATSANGNGNGGG